MDLDLAFTRRLLRFDPAALVRVRPAGPGQAELWGRLPWEVLVAVTVAVESSAGSTVDDRVYAAADGKPRDAQWRVGLPPATKRAVEQIPTHLVSNAARAAALTLQEATAVGVGGKPVGERALRDALLDHPVITGQSDVDGLPFVVPQRLVQAMARMGFLADDSVIVYRAGPWTGLGTSMGSAWFRPPSSLTVQPIVNHPLAQ